MKTLEEMATHIIGSVGMDANTFYEEVLAYLEVAYAKGVVSVIRKEEEST